MPRIIGGKEMKSKTIALANLKVFSENVDEMPLFTVLKEEFKNGIRINKVILKSEKPCDCNLLLFVRSETDTGIKYISVGKIESSDKSLIELGKDAGFVAPGETIMVNVPNIDLAWLTITILFSEA